ncbi:uncharacterized protein F4807DRAFT_469127 [Annulohypoxylon truncatum]|uniref:uncharacterized protein n=1 Tax=Annulohypoxylon truncatum TaxID=327061 RepID=UPI002007D8A3|nr:uncharacterized protein F4807DRAFT_469127 [Annulohypoxylon truncatum]KAI1207602.1 hypothetical protein F4807DRAFT_469127 [Annulohypoxylon truncatum]
MSFIVFSISCLVFVSSLVSLGLRLYSRKLTKAGLDWDDGLIVAAEAIVIALFGLSIYLWDPGWSRDSLRELGHSSHTVLTLLLLFEVLHLTAMFLAKLSALYLYARIFIQDKFRLACKLAAVTVILIYIVMFVDVMTVSDIAIALWQNPIIGGPSSMKAVDVTVSILNIVGNATILFLPIPPIWKLQMKVKTKINLTIVFCLGICVAVVSCIRLSFVIRQDYDTDTLMAYGSRDMHLNVLEPELAIFCLSLPIIRPLWLKLREKYRAARGQPCVDDKSSIAAASGHENDDDRNLVSWKEVIAGDTSKYDIYIHGGTSKATGTKPGQSPYRQRLQPRFAASPHRQPMPPQSSQIKVDKSWSVSYESASLMR